MDDTGFGTLARQGDRWRLTFAGCRTRPKRSGER